MTISANLKRFLLSFFVLSLTLTTSSIAFSAEVDVMFESTPSGAFVTVDGKPACNKTPCNASVEEGVQQVIIQLGYHNIYKRMENLKDGRVVRAKLTPYVGWLKVVAPPEGLSVQVKEWREKRTENLDKMPLEPGRYSIKLDSPCMEETTQTVTIRRARTTTLRPRISGRTVPLIIKSFDTNQESAKATVYVDDRKVGQAPGTINVSACSKSLKVEGEAGVYYKTLRLADREKMIVRAILQKDDRNRVQIELGNAPIKGNADAPITIIEFSDFECPFCARASMTVKKIFEDYEGKVRLAFINFPLPIHANAKQAAAAALAAGEQGDDKFWAMHDALFQDEAKDFSVAGLMKKARMLGLDMAAFETAMLSDRINERIDKEFDKARELGLTGAPTFFINGLQVVGAQPYEKFRDIIEEELQNQ